MRITPYDKPAGTYGSNSQRIPVSSSDFKEQLSLKGESRAEKTNNGLDYLGTKAPEEVKEAWDKAEKESGINGMVVDSEGKLTQITKLFVMSVESVHNGGRSDILGDTVDSAKSAVQTALDRLGIPQNRKEEKEKLFYEAFLRYLA